MENNYSLNRFLNVLKSDYAQRNGIILAQDDCKEWAENLEQLIHNIGWHPVSEPPKLKQGEDDVEFIVLLAIGSYLQPTYANYCKITGWSKDYVCYWTNKPKEE